MHEDRGIPNPASAMNGPMMVRTHFLSGQVRRVAQAMRAAIESSPRPPHGPTLAEVIDVASRRILSDAEEACALAGLDEVQGESLMVVSRRGIEDFIKACGIALLEEIRAGNIAPDRDAMLRRVDQVLPRIQGVNRAGLLTRWPEDETLSVSDGDRG